MAFKFEELRVWEMAISLSAEVNVLIKTFLWRSDLYSAPNFNGLQIR